MNDQQRYVFEHPRCYGFNDLKHFQTGASIRDYGRWRVAMTIEPRGQDGCLSWVASVSRFNKARGRTMEKSEWTNSIRRNAADRAAVTLAGVGEGTVNIQETMNSMSFHAMFFYKPMSDAESEEIIERFGKVPEGKSVNMDDNPEIWAVVEAEARELKNTLLAKGRAPEDAMKAAQHFASVEYRVRLVEAQGLKFSDPDSERPLVE